MHRVYLTRSEYVVAQLYQVLNVSDHVLAAVGVDVGHQTVLLDEVGCEHVPEPPKLIGHYLRLGDVVGSAESLELVLELLYLLQKLVDVPTGLGPSLDAAPFVTVGHVADDVLDGLPNQRKLLFECLVWVHAPPGICVRVALCFLGLRHCEQHLEALSGRELLETLI